MKPILAKGFLVLFCTAQSMAQFVTVTGNAFLEGQTDHSDIKIVFVRTAPSPLSDSAYTNSAGAYNASIQQGVYAITYSKPGYLPVSVADVPIGSSMSLGDATLETAGLSGNLSGVLTAGTYKVSGNIAVASTDSLRIMPGVKLLFQPGVGFSVNGYLEAAGTPSDSIVFSAYDTAQRWDGIWFNGSSSSGSKLSYALIELSRASGIRVNSASPSLTHLLVRKNSMSHGLAGAYYGGGGIYVGGGLPILDQLVVADNISGADGGGIYVGSSGIQRITNSVIARNSSSGGRGGGGIYCSGGGLTLNNMVIAQNVAGAQGGAVNFNSRQGLVINNVLISNNSGGGGSLYLEPFSDPLVIRITNMTLVGETGTNGIMITGNGNPAPNVLSLHNSIIANNKARGLYFNNPGNTVADIRSSCFYGNLSGNIGNGAPLVGTNVTVNAKGDSCDPWYNIHLSPTFTDLANANYHLALGSHCTNAGGVDTSMLPTDLDGNSRLVGRAVDMGCYESQTIVSDSVHALSQFVTVTGNAFLEGQADHSNLKIVFVRTAPAPLVDSAYTNNLGAFSTAVQEGVYTITYMKDGFLPVALGNRPIYSSTSLANTTLETAGLSGNLSGVLTAGTYKVSGNIAVASTDSLRIMPGVKLLFQPGVGFSVNGYLEAAGTPSDSIVFSAYDTAQRWDGIWFNGSSSSGSKLSYALIELSRASGIRVNSASPSLTHLLVRKNSMSHGLAGAYYGGGGIYVGGGLPILDQLVVADNISGADGGGIYVGSSGIQRITNSVIARNSSSGGRGGGGIYCSGGGLTLNNMVIAQNVAGAQGGAVNFNSRQGLVINNVLISNNSGGGGSLYLEPFSDPLVIRITNMTLVGETGTNGIMITGNGNPAPNVLSLHNSIIANNKARGLYFNNPGNTVADIRNSCFYGNLSGNIGNGAPLVGTNLSVNTNGDSCDAWNNIHLSPMFRDSANANYHLALGSHCTNAGGVDTSMLPTDLDGNSRLVGRAVDMGCYESQSVLSLNARSLHFGATRIGRSKDSVVALTNIGDQTISVSSITSNNGVFSVRPGTLAIAASASLMDTLEFSPAAAGTAAGHIVIGSNAPTSPDTIAVAGFGADYTFTVSSKNLDLGTLRVGRVKDTVITIVNTGNAALVIDSITSNHSSITCVPPSLTLAVGGSATETIRFSPTRGGSVAGNIVINGNGSTSPDTIVIAGFGATYGYVLSTYTVDLGNVRVGLTRDTVVTLRNTGNQPIVISSIISSVPQLIPSPGAFTIAVGEGVRDTLRFTPATAGRLMGKVVFMSDSLWGDTLTVAANGVLTGVSEKAEMPKEYSLHQNYPNPFNPSTTIRYALPQKSTVSLRIYNALGQGVAELVEGDQEAGYHEVKFDASNLSSGFYIYRLRAGDFVQTKKLLLVR